MKKLLACCMVGVVVSIVLGLLSIIFPVLGYPSIYILSVSLAVAICSQLLVTAVDLFLSDD